MATGLSLISSSFIIFQNFLLALCGTIFLRQIVGKTIYAPLLAFMLILFKEIVEIFIEPGTAAVSDVAAAWFGVSIARLLTRPKRGYGEWDGWKRKTVISNLEISERNDSLPRRGRRPRGVRD